MRELERLNALCQKPEAKAKIEEIAAGILRKNGKWATAYAEAERAYKIKLREVCLKLKGEGMAIGMISLTCYGVPEIAELRFKRDVAETVYKANQEAINSIKLQLRLLDNQVSREWSTPQAGM